MFLEALTGGWGAGGGGSRVACLNFKITRVGVCRSFSVLTSLSEFCWDRMSFVVTSFYVLSLLFGPCRLSEFTLSGPLTNSDVMYNTETKWKILW